MTDMAFILDSTPRVVERAPFASESGLQRFVEDHADEMLGIRVVGSSRQLGASVFKIDILGIDQNGKAWIIECKHDKVDSGALGQLHHYRSALLDDWAAVKARVADRHHVALSDVEPGLVLIGYRYDEKVASGGAICLAYRYHDFEFTDDELQTQRPGHVSLQRIEGARQPTRAHPKVSKKNATSERLERLAPAVAGAFWDIDSKLQEDQRVKVKYGGKNFVRYRTRNGVFAEAVITPNAIEWRIKLTSMLQSDEQTTTVLEMLLEAAKAG
jgi:hypothetical protein